MHHLHKVWNTISNSYFNDIMLSLMPPSLIKLVYLYTKNLSFSDSISKLFLFFRPILIFLCLCYWCFSAKHSYATGIEEVLAQVCRTYPEIIAKAYTNAIADEQKKQAFSAFLPELNGYANLTAGIIENPDSITYETASSDEYALKLKYPLFAGGKFYYQYQLAKAKEQSHYYDFLHFQRQILLHAAQSYINLLATQELLQLQHSLSNNLRAYRQLVHKKYVLKDTTFSNFKESEARLFASEADVIRIRGDVDKARHILQEFLGQPLSNTYIWPKMVIPVPKKHLLDSALQNSFQLHAIRAHQRVVEASIHIAKSHFFPTLNSFASLSFGKNSTVLPQSHTDRTLETNLILQIDVPLYQGGKHKSALRVAKYEKAQTNETLTHTRNMVIQQVMQAIVEYEVHYRSMRTYSKSIASKQKAIESFRKEFSSGTREILEVLYAEQQLLELQSQAVSSKKNMFHAIYVLLALTGTLEQFSGPACTDINHRKLS